ncbi:hypothetical protein E8E13_003647 [Curvularia kusanoi]|uniref:Heterokaryon incompatibility domain-containing protein n=1 Tax=Curvularia kusanoi TaxID=90978 RepID=A0A9P4T5Y3_CURKU|nr:hypothetical protein E8E13_003647 [Curvularia kusanoi]
MRLLETTDGRTYRLTEDYLHQSQVPAYAILSHTWTEGHEVTFDDIHKDERSKYRKLRSSLQLRPHFRKKGYDKLRFCAKQAKRDGLRYFWVDTCCIDKSNSPELQRAINSMFQWYQNATKCYVFLSDVSSTSAKSRYGSSGWEEAFKKGRWFTRGWTLQELLAPTTVEFFSKQGVYLGSRLQLKQLIHDITNIPPRALSGASLDEFDVDQKLSWAAERQTTRIEDEVYALLGIFGIELPFIYDEGYDKALRRLLEKIYYAPHEAQQRKWVIKSTVPFGRDNEFVTRDELSVLNRIYEKPGQHAALVGLGGVGKSQIAIECTYRMLDQVPDLWVFWVYAETKASFRKSYYKIAETVGMNGWNDPTADIMQLVCAWLGDEANGRWMMVIDSADDAGVFATVTPDSCMSNVNHSTTSEQPYLAHIPRTSRSSILITSRSHEVASMLIGSKNGIVEVGPMTTQDARTLLRTKINAAIQESEGEELIRLLDHVPLALTQAAAFINRTPRMSIKRYLDGLRDSQAADLLDKNMVDIRRNDQVSNSVMTTWSMSFDYVRSRSAPAARLLSFMSLFDRQEIPATLLQYAYSSFEEEDAEDAEDANEAEDANDANFEDDIYLLTSLCLVKSNAGNVTFQMHGIMQDAMWCRLKSQDKFEHWATWYIVILDIHFPRGKREDWSKCQKLLPHALAALTHVLVDADVLEVWASLAHRVGSYLSDMGDYSKGYDLLFDSWEVRKILLGPEHIVTLGCLNSLGLALQGLHRYDEAKDVLRQAYEGQERLLEAENDIALTTLSNIASVHLNLKEYSKAEEVLKNVLQRISKLELGPGHRLNSIALLRLALVYRESGRLEDAVNLHLQALELHKMHLGLDHPLTWIAKIELASAYRKQGCWKEAETLHLELIETLETQQAEALELLTQKSLLFSAYQAQGRLDDAEATQIQVLALSKEMLGHAHVRTLEYMSELVLAYRLAGKHEKAETLLVEELELRKTHQGEDHLETLRTKSLLSQVYAHHGKYTEAVHLQSVVIECYTKELGEDNSETLEARKDLSATFRRQGRLTEARSMQEEILKRRIELLGRDHMDSLNTMVSLALTYKDQGQVAEAIELMSECRERFERVANPGLVKDDTWRMKERIEEWTREQENDGREKIRPADAALQS